MGNGPHAIAPWGGNRGLFGTNPIGFAAPRENDAPLIIDMSLSKVARGKINVAAQADDPIPLGWAFDADGNETTDAKAAMAGTMAPMGDAKGAQLVLMVEILAAALSASCFGFEASSYFEAEGEPPRAGQFMLAINPGPFSGRSIWCLVWKRSSKPSHRNRVRACPVRIERLNEPRPQTTV